MADVGQIEPNPKRMKSNNGVEQLNIGDDLSSPNTALTNVINRRLFLDEETADIHFLVDNTGGDIDRIPAHKLILSTGSKVFKTMFYGSIPEGNDVKISNGISSAFKEFLQFFYLDEITLTSENIAQVMNFVRQYGIERCMVRCTDFLKDTMTNNDVCSGCQLAIQFGLDDLKRFCERKISNNAENVLKTDDFLNCSGSVFRFIVELDSLMCEEKNVFDACVAWAKNSCDNNSLDAGDMKNLRDQLGSSLYFIHFQRMKCEDFASRNAEYMGLFTLPELTEIMQIVTNDKFKPHLFTTEALSYDIFTWDENRVLEVSLSDKLRDGKCRMVNESDESFNLWCNKPLLLNKIKFAKVNPSNISRVREAYESPFQQSNISRVFGGRGGSDGSEIVIEIFQKIDSVFDGTVVEHSLFNQNFHISTEQETFVEFSKPILIHPERFYKIRLSYHYSGLYDTTKLKCEKIVYDDLEINFSNEVGRSNFGLVSAMFFNQL